MRMVLPCVVPAVLGTDIACAALNLLEGELLSAMAQVVQALAVVMEPAVAPATAVLVAP